MWENTSEGTEFCSIRHILLLKIRFSYYWLVILFNNLNMCHRIRYCVFSCPRAISIVSSNQILCHCSAIMLITDNYYYLPVFCSAILLFTGIISFTGILLFCYSTHCWVCLSAVECWSYSLLYFIGTCSQFICCWRLTLCLLIVPYIMYNVLLLGYASMPFALSCSPQ